MDKKSDRLLPLGYQRLRLLGCLGGDIPSAPGYFNPALGADLFSAFHDYVAHLSRTWSTETDPHSISLLAAARLLTGGLDAAMVILDHLPAKTVRLDHGTGYCVVMPQTALLTALPLPSTLGDIDLWLAGSTEQDQLRTWLTANRERLVWNETDGIYWLK